MPVSMKMKRKMVDMNQKYICKRCKWEYDPEIMGKSLEDQGDGFICPKCNEAYYNFLPSDITESNYSKYLKRMRKVL